RLTFGGSGMNSGFFSSTSDGGSLKPPPGASAGVIGFVGGNCGAVGSVSPPSFGGIGIPPGNGAIGPDVGAGPTGNSICGLGTAIFGGTRGSRSGMTGCGGLASFVFFGGASGFFVSGALVFCVGL